MKKQKKRTTYNFTPPRRGKPITSILFINTAERENSYVIFLAGDSRREKTIRNRNVLTACDFLLKKENMALKKLNGIIVVTGPGQFSSLRAGITVANTLGFACSIPISGVQLLDSIDTMIDKGLKKLSRFKKFHPIGAEYGKEPNISMKHRVRSMEHRT